jgi:chromosome segregation ATPase
MKPTRLISIGCAIAAIVAGPVLLAADPAPADDRLRTELRDTTLQLRSAQSELADAQALQASTVGDRDAAVAQRDALKKQLASAQTAAEKSVGDLQSQLVALKAENARLSDALNKARSTIESATRDNQDESARNAKLKSETIVLSRKVSDLESKNLALFLTGNEILTRYQDFSLGTALSAKEPFVGSTRTRLENLIQDYQDKLSDQRARN